jgi:hypothetical protein
MANDGRDERWWLDALSMVPEPRADEERADRTRARCLEALARQRASGRGWRRRVRSWTPVLEAAGVAALALFYLGGAVRHALTLLGR